MKFLDVFITITLQHVLKHIQIFALQLKLFDILIIEVIDLTFENLKGSKPSLIDIVAPLEAENRLRFRYQSYLVNRRRLLFLWEVLLGLQLFIAPFSVPFSEIKNQLVFIDWTRGYFVFQSAPIHSFGLINITKQSNNNQFQKGSHFIRSQFEQLQRITISFLIFIDNIGQTILLIQNMLKLQNQLIIQFVQQQRMIQSAKLLIIKNKQIDRFKISIQPIDHKMVQLFLKYTLKALLQLLDKVDISRYTQGLLTLTSLTIQFLLSQFTVLANFQQPWNLLSVCFGNVAGAPHYFFCKLIMKFIIDLKTLSEMGCRNYLQRVWRDRITSYSGSKYFNLQYPSLDQYNWSCAWYPIPECRHISTQTKEEAQSNYIYALSI